MSEKEFITVSVEGANVRFEIRINNIPLKFRIHFIDKIRKNSRYVDRTASDLYFEGLGTSNSNLEGTYSITRATDALLFAERHTQWMLENAFRFFENQERKKYEPRN